MKRFFDIVLCLLLLLILTPPMIVIAIVIRLTSPGRAIYWSKRVGLNNQIFLMPKFRSMRIDTPQIATHLLSDPKEFLTPIGSFLRKSSLDELPQLFSVLKGDMSFVGPRPALFNQEDLIELRTQKNVHTLRPGITGWAQVNGRDELPIPKKVEFDAFYLNHQSISLDAQILLKTFVKVTRADGVHH
ncbi:MAG: sugar transferase [Bdellovibrionales bacterium]|nr:sugar transferase [Bdellovibrionales bacterium]